jgi:hypothetical protein
MPAHVAILGIPLAPGDTCWTAEGDYRPLGRSCRGAARWRLGAWTILIPPDLRQACILHRGRTAYRMGTASQDIGPGGEASLLLGLWGCCWQTFGTIAHVTPNVTCRYPRGLDASARHG